MQPKKRKECFWTVLQYPVGSMEVGTGFRTAWLHSSVQDLAPSNKTSCLYVHTVMFWRLMYSLIKGRDEGKNTNQRQAWTSSPVRLLMKRALFAVVFRTRSEAMMSSKKYNPSAFETRRVFEEAQALEKLGCKPHDATKTCWCPLPVQYHGHPKP